MSIRHVCTHVSSVPYYWSPSTPSTSALIRLQSHALATCIASRAITPLLGWMHAHTAPLGVAERVSVSPPGLIDVTSCCFTGWGPRDAWPLRSPVSRSGSPGACSAIVRAVPAVVVDATPLCNCCCAPLSTIIVASLQRCAAWSSPFLHWCWRRRVCAGTGQVLSTRRSESTTVFGSSGRFVSNTARASPGTHPGRALAV